MPGIVDAIHVHGLLPVKIRLREHSCSMSGRFCRFCRRLSFSDL